MFVHTLDQSQQLYIQSEVAFQRAKSRGFWEMVQSLLKRQNPYLESFDALVNAAAIAQGTYLGCRDMPLPAICGSIARSQDFTRRFSPRYSHVSYQEGWRNIYVLAMAGRGLPPVELYQLGDCFIVQDGHTRISVAAYLGWHSIQAHITQL